jgi:hypothetical protein
MADKMADKNAQKRAQKFYCKTCDYVCYKKCDLDRHFKTAKHERLTNADKNAQKRAPPIMQSTDGFNCDCGKSYKHRQSLHKHQLKCKFVKKTEEEKEEENEVNLDEDNISYKNLLIQSMKENSLLREELTETRKEIMGMVPLIGNNNNNTTNNNFNLNLFLNETCKDALNITDFINSLRLQLKDVEYTTDNGHVKGITNIFHNALSNMEENKRPLHCTDLKREVLYIKDNDEWHIDEDKDKLKEAVQTVTNKNIGNTGKWLEKYPDHNKAESKDFEKYIKMTTNIMGTGEEGEQNKILKNILKEVTIEKK